jgi:molecular chaperone DnaK (HSP70)
VLRIINEPTAACLAYGLDKRREGVIAVYDLGGGTFDISILRVQEGVFQVLATNGDTHLGGDDIDRLLVEQVAADLGLDPATQADAVQAVRKAVIQAKWDLSEFDETDIEVAGIPGRAEPYRRHLTRAGFESLIAPIVARTLEPCRRALEDAGLSASQVDEAVLVGGSTRIPMVRREVERLFGRAPHTDLNPDEVVAIGAAVQADILVSGRREMLLLDVTPLSLGIETMGGVVSKIILRNSTIPASGSEMFTTFVDSQTAVDIHILQGEREMAADNRSLGRFKLRGIPPMPAGLPRIQVRFQIDANGILSVSAHELRTGIAQTIEVKPSYGLTDQEVERMLIESFEHAQEDVDARMLIEVRNEAETIIGATEKTLRRPDFAEIAAARLTQGEVALIQAALADLKQAMGSPDRNVIQVKAAALNQATQHLAEVMMNWTIQAALAGRTADEVAAKGR